ncbi:MAG: translocation/assembly module TamB domain-containing protein [Atribacterota bacterium]|nr:translocation/assembly module TamB domain-containing protein [Atribacterota bacterium]
MPGKKTFFKKIIIVLFVVALITGGYFAIRGNLAKNRIKTQIISSLENAIDRGIYIGQVKDYSLHSITLSMFKIFKNSSLKEEDLLFETEEVTVNYDLDILSVLKRGALLSVEDVTLTKPQMTLVRDTQGTFDFIEKFNLKSDNFAVSINRVNFHDGNLDYIDYQTTKEEGLLTKINSLNGYFYLENLPKVEFNCSGLSEENNTPLAIKGYFFRDRTDYSLDFNFKDADITHFQYYFTETKPFNLKKGLFDLNLHLAKNLDIDKGKTIWYGQASARDVDLSPDFLDGMEFNQAEGFATFDSKETIIEKATALYKSSPFTLEGILTYIDDFSYDLKVKSDDFKLSDLEEGLKEHTSLSQEFQAKGKSNLSFEVSGLQKNFQLQGELLTEQGEIQGYDFSFLRAEFNYDQDGFYFTNVKAEVGGGVVEGTGKIILKDELSEYDILFNLTQFDVESDFLKSFHLDYLKKGLLSGKIEIRGVSGQGEQLNLSAEAKVKNDAGILSLNVEGTVAENNYLNLKVNASGINLEELGEILNYNEIKGLANFNGELSGLLDDPKIKGTIKSEKGQISELPFDYLEGELDYQGSILKLEDLLFQNEGLTFKGGGSADFFETKDEMQVKVSLQIEQADLNYLAKYFNIESPLSGSVQGDIFIQSHGSQFEVNGDLQIKKVDMINYNADSGNLIFSLKDKKISIKSLVLNSGKSQLYVKGEVSLEEGLPLDLRVSFLNQRIVHLMSYFLPPDLISKFRGKATGSLEIKGSYTSPDLYLSALIEDAQLEKMPINSIEVKLDKIDSMIRINQLKLSQRKGELTAGGWINLDEDNKNLNIHLSADNLDLSQLSNLFSIEDKIEGLINFKAEMTGDVDLPIISFSTRVEKGKFQDFVFDNLTFEALYDQDILEVKQFVLDKEGHQVKGKGKIPYKFSFMDKEKITPSFTDIPIDFVLTLENTDLSSISMFFRKNIKQIQGLTNTELKLSGTLNQPILNGNIALNIGLIEFYKLPVKISDANVLLRLEDNLVKIEDMNFQIDQYKIYASGEFALKNLQFQDLNINIWSNKEEILYQDILKAQADLKAKLTGLFTYPHLEGILTLSQGELNWKKNNKKILSNPLELLAKLNNLKGDIDLEVQILDDFIANTNDFNLKLEGGLKVQGALSAPKLNGGLDIKQGYVTFLDKKFRVSEGKIIFADSTGEDMILDIKAKTEIDDIDVFVSVGGILAQPVVTFSSSPALSESEIISLLMFNKNYAGLTEGEIGTVLQEEMINLIAQGLSIRFLNQIEDEIANSLGLDEFKIETIFKQEQGSDLGFVPGFALETLALKIGKYFSENFYLSYSTPLFEMGIGDLELEYKLKNDLTLSTQIGSVGSQDDEFELKFELKFEF